MATPAKKQSFLGGAAILAAAVVIVKLIGAATRSLSPIFWAEREKLILTPRIKFTTSC